jgi:hypothetical protein
VTIVQNAFPPEKTYVIGLPPEEQPLSENSQKMVDAVLNIVEIFLDSDEDKRNVGRACDTIGNIVETCGASAVHSSNVFFEKNNKIPQISNSKCRFVGFISGMNTIATLLSNILTNKATCQQVDDPDDGPQISISSYLFIDLTFNFEIILTIISLCLFLCL